MNISNDIRLIMLINDMEPQLTFANLYNIGYDILDIKDISHLPSHKYKYFTYLKKTPTGIFDTKSHILLLLCKLSKRNCYISRFNVFKDMNKTVEIPYCLNNDFVNWMAQYNPGYYSFIDYKNRNSKFTTPFSPYSNITMDESNKPVFI